ncbi:MAG: S9 family peptidase [Chloroflexota bacterium]
MKSKRLIQPDDLYNMVTVESPVLSPDGERVAFVKMTRHPEPPRYERSIWLVNSDGSSLRQLTASGKLDRSPAWAPDGKKLAFISDRHGKPQVFVIHVGGGEAHQITAMPNGASAPAWSPDSTRIAFLSAMRDDEMDAEDNGAAMPESPASDLMVFDNVPVDFTASGRVAQIYITAADGTGNPQRIGRAGARNGYGAPQWLPDGQTLISSNSSNPHHDAPWIFKQTVSVNIAEGTATPITGTDYRAYDPLPSPVGKTLAVQYRAGNLPVNVQTHLGLVPIGGGDMTPLTESLDRAVELHAWAAEADVLYFAVRDAGYIRLYRVKVPDGEPEIIDIGDCTITALHAGGNGRVVFDAFRADGTHELYLHDGETLHMLTQFNAAWLAEVDVRLPEEVRYTAADGQALQGWLMKPTRFDDTKTYPLAVNIHGGPSMFYGPAVHWIWFEFQHHAANGYGVFYCNPRGSTGYGEAFIVSNRANWGERPAGDVLAGVDAALEQAAWIDGERLAVTGGSYGGYLTTWIVGHDDRFKTAVAQRGPYDMHSFHGTTDIPVFVSSNMGDEPWENPDVYAQQSPMSYTHAINTPLLIIHSTQDVRVPVGQAIELFTMLKRQGKTVQLVIFPEEGHELSRSGRPDRMIERLNRIIGWWDRYCKAPATTQGD